jgi:NAD(P)-dependent dehydrogenase (short-subunit alcohol dehydrogenase family)
MPDPFTTTADEVLAGIDLTGRQIVITGATAGLGLAAARAFARAGADIVLTGRDAARLAAAQETVDADGSGTITTEQADLADLNAVAELAEKLKASLTRLDVLVLNAGIMAAPLERSAQGHEMQLAVSHLAHHLLTTALIDLLKASKTRVVALSSSGHGLSPFDFADPNFTTRDYDKWAAYGQAKTATALFAVAMANRFGNDGIVTVAVHPGVIKTDLQRHLSEAEEEYVLSMSAEQGEVRSVEAGASSIVWAAIAAEVANHNGSYIANCSIANALRAPHASSSEQAARLWNLTEELVATSR